MKLIYVVEDHQVIREGVRRYLELAGYKVIGFGNIASVREAFKITKADLLIQDVMLPDGDGFEFVKELRTSTDIPVIFMTAKIAEEDRIHGFELGADDYISKPFSPKEHYSFESVIRKMTSAVASRLGLKDRGFVREGFKADLVLFDPKALKDNSDMAHPFERCSGLEHVMVNGVFALKNGEITHGLSGKVLNCS